MKQYVIKMQQMIVLDLQSIICKLLHEFDYSKTQYSKEVRIVKIYNSFIIHQLAKLARLVGFRLR